MITKDQLDILRDMLENCDEDWLLDHLSLMDRGNRHFSLHVEKGNWQDYVELFGIDEKAAVQKDLAGLTALLHECRLCRSTDIAEIKRIGESHFRCQMCQHSWLTVTPTLTATGWVNKSTF